MSAKAFSIALLNNTCFICALEYFSIPVSISRVDRFKDIPYNLPLMLILMFRVTHFQKQNLLIHIPKPVTQLELVNHTFAHVSRHIRSAGVPRLVEDFHLQLFNSNCRSQQNLLPYSISAFPLAVDLTSIATRSDFNF